MITPALETAYAKINLALHVRARRADGYHQLETVFAFLDQGDHLTCANSDRFSLTLSGKFADGLADESVSDNLIFRAANLYAGGVEPAVAFRLEKSLPIAAGLGGGSADAAAALRLLNTCSSAPLPTERLLEIAALLGADVPACIGSVPVTGRGIGTMLEQVENDVSGLSCLLVNPNKPLSTAPVFRAWDGLDRGPMPQGSARDILLGGRNDLEIPAIRLCPEIAEILLVLKSTRPLVSRMSGSGATCFALYEDTGMLEQVRTEISSMHPEWWTMAGQLR